MRTGYLASILMSMSTLSIAAPAIQTCSPPTPPLTDTAVEQFAEMAAIKSFTYDFKALPNQLHALKPCYTKTGWHSFSLALQRAGNITTTKENKLYVHAEKAGDVKTLSKQANTNAWRVLVPIKVTYNNKTHTIAQNLDVKVLMSIDENKLGVEQITASPTLPVTPEAPTNETPSASQDTTDPSAKTT